MINTIRQNCYYFVFNIIFCFLIIFTSALHAENTATNKMQLYLELIVNGASTGHIAVIDYEQGEFFILPQDLAATNIAESHWQFAPKNTKNKISLNNIDGVSVEYEQNMQRLLISVPPSWLPGNELSLLGNRQYQPALTDTGAVLNYDLFVSKNHHNTNLGLWHEFRTFGRYGALTTSGTYRKSFKNNNNNQNKYLRYDTKFRYSNDSRLLTFEAGDIITRTLSWNNAVRLAGVQLSHHFSLRPDIITYPMPQFSGENDLPTAVDLFVNGSKVNSENIDSGPFTLSNIPFISGAGEATVVTTDALGRSVSTTVQLYVTETLLRPGLTDYSVALGSFRKNYGLKNFDYGDFAFDGNFRHGLTRYFTLEGRAGGTRDLQLFGVGGVTQLNVFGSLNFAYTKSYWKSESGSKMNLGYRYIHRNFSFSAQHERHYKAFRPLSEESQIIVPDKQNYQLTLGIPLKQFGTLGVGYFYNQRKDDKESKVMNISWSKSFQDWGSFYAAINKNYDENNFSGVFQWNIPLFSKRRDIFSLLSQRNSEKKWSQRVNYQRSVYDDSGLGWNLSYQFNDGNDDYRQADGIWRTKQFELKGGVYGTNSNNTVWGNANGAVILMDNHLFASRAINDTFVVVSTEKVPNIGVYYDNRYLGNTDRDGYFVISEGASYYAGRYSIDPSNAPISMKVDKIERILLLREKSGYLLRFGLKPIRTAYVALVDQKGNPLSMGLKAELNGQSVSDIGWDGMVYYDNIENDNKIIVEFPDHSTCSVLFSVSAEKSRLSNKKLTCIKDVAQ